MNTEMTWNTKIVMYRKESYHVAEESFGMN